MAKKVQVKSVNNEIKCCDCIHSVADQTNLSFNDLLPILCTCQFQKHAQLYNHINVNCINSKIKKP